MPFKSANWQPTCPLLPSSTSRLCFVCHKPSIRFYLISSLISFLQSLTQKIHTKSWDKNTTEGRCQHPTTCESWNKDPTLNWIEPRRKTTTGDTYLWSSQCFSSFFFGKRIICEQIIIKDLIVNLIQLKPGWQFDPFSATSLVLIFLLKMLPIISLCIIYS